jgi:hypothetical protein
VDAAKQFWSWGFPVEGRFRRWLRLWKSIGRAALQPLSKRLVQSRRRLRVAGWRDVFERARDRNVRVELSAPHEDVQALDLLDQQRDRPARRCNLCARVVLESAAPSTQDIELLGVKSPIGHAARLPPKRAHCFRVTAPQSATATQFDRLAVVREQVGSSGPPWRLSAVKGSSAPRRQPDEASR